MKEVCTHQNFKGEIAVNRLTREEGGEVRSFMADLRISCADCGRPFQFIGVPFGLLSDKPTMSADMQELRIPIHPDGEILNPLFAEFVVRAN